jgi:hypothetical protein
MKNWVIGVYALLTAGVAQGEESARTYARVGSWEISAEPPSRRCVMHRSYRSKAGNKSEGLTVLYAADKEGVLLVWSNDWMTYLPAKGDLDLGLAFKKGASVDEAWGSRSLHYDKVADLYYFTRAFTDAEETRRILRDLAANDSIGLFLGPALITNLPLDAFDAVEKLRECSLNGGRAP